MAIVLGIDEAGFGPLLGPLVVTQTAWRVPDDRIRACLWRILRCSCTKNPRRSNSRLLVADSKTAHRPHLGLALLERSVLVTMGVAGFRPARFSELLDLLCPGVSASVRDHCWYVGPDECLPTDPATGDLVTRINALRTDCRREEVSYLGASCETILEGPYNELVQKSRNKALVLVDAVMRLIWQALEKWSDEQVVVYVDRLGGRRYYREALTTALGCTDLHVLEESEQVSSYRFLYQARQCEVRFRCEAESFHFPVALASMYSKYLRELFMRRFNAFFASHDGAIRPTCGYYTDAKRWLRDAGPLLSRLGLDRSLLVRQR